MAVYCFPKPEEDQRLMIRTIGFAENVARDIKYEEPDYVKLANIRREALANIKSNPNITGMLILLLFVVPRAEGVGGYTAQELGGSVHELIHLDFKRAY